MGCLSVYETTFCFFQTSILYGVIARIYWYSTHLPHWILIIIFLVTAVKSLEIQKMSLLHSRPGLLLTFLLAKTPQLSREGALISFLFSSFRVNSIADKSDVSLLLLLALFHFFCPFVSRSLFLLFSLSQKANFFATFGCSKREFNTVYFHAIWNYL